MIDGGWVAPLGADIEQDATLELDRALAAGGQRTLEILERRRGSIHRRGWLIRRLLLTADLLALCAAFATAEVVAHANSSHLGRVGFDWEAILFVLSLPAWAVVARLYGLYQQDDRRAAHSTVDEAVQLFHMLTVGAWLLFAFAWVTGVAHPAVGKLLVFWITAVATVPLARLVVRRLARNSLTYVQNTVIVGAGDVGQRIAEKLLRHPEFGVNIVGFVDSEPKEQRPALEHLTLLGPLERLSAIIRAFDVERVIVAFSRERSQNVLDVLRSLRDPWVQIDIVPRYFELIGFSTTVSSIEDLPLLTLPPRGLPPSTRLLKRALDLVAGTGLLLMLAIPLALIACAVKLTSRGPVFFRQLRIGAGGRAFRIVKFRTMFDGADDQKTVVAHLNRHAAPGRDPRMFKIIDDPRVTRVGKILRRHSLDELPQLLNVLRGQMSLVGPRPLIPEEDSLVDAWGRTRLDLKPGMTGVWQVAGRSEIPFEEMLALDYRYVTTWSLWNDLRLLCKTVPAVMSARHGAY